MSGQRLRRLFDGVAADVTPIAVDSVLLNIEVSQAESPARLAEVPQHFGLALVTRSGKGLEQVDDLRVGAVHRGLLQLLAPDRVLDAVQVGGDGSGGILSDAKSHGSRLPFRA